MAQISKYVPDGKKPKVYQLRQLVPSDGFMFMLQQGLSLDEILAQDGSPAVYVLTDVPSKDGQLTVIGIDGRGLRKVDDTHLVTKHKLHIQVEDAEMV